VERIYTEEAGASFAGHRRDGCEVIEISDASVVG
jgi:hypothetical protein